MASRAKDYFDRHISECRDAISVHEYLVDKSGYRAEFNLRFVWIAAVSSLDHFISQLIIEKSVEQYAKSQTLQPKLLIEAISFEGAIELRNANENDSVVVFRGLVAKAVTYKSFQSPENIADGLSFIWGKSGKWDAIGSILKREGKQCRYILKSIVDRRNVIAHNADVDEVTGDRFPVTAGDAKRVVGFITEVVSAIDVAIDC